MSKISKIIPIGARVLGFGFEKGDEYMLVQTEPGVGRVIEINSGNRVNDADIPLNRYGGVYGAKLEDIPEHVRRLFDNHEKNKIEPVICAKPKMLPPHVDLVRYIRPRNELTGEVDNLKGVTLLIRIDYDTRLIHFQYSICDGDNFNKKAGVAVATNRMYQENGTYCIPLENGKVSREGVVDDIIQKLRLDVSEGCGCLDRQSAIKIIRFYESSKDL